jgi:hypothetical protein
MKKIQPISIWYNGQIVIDTIFDLVSISDNLNTTAIFYYSLYSISFVMVLIPIPRSFYQIVKFSPAEKSTAWTGGGGRHIPWYHNIPITSNSTNSKFTGYIWSFLNFEAHFPLV